MRPALRKMLKDKINTRRAGIEKEIVSLNQAEELLKQDDLPTTWHIFIGSAWITEGEESSNGDYVADSLNEALRMAATDFCKLNRRIIPGQPKSGGGTWDRWDVQGTWHVSLKVGAVFVDIPTESFKHHLRKINHASTQKDYFSEPKKKVAKIA